MKPIHLILISALVTGMALTILQAQSPAIVILAGTDVQSLMVNGRRHFVNAGDYDAIQKGRGIGKNWRTAKMVGGGTVFGSVLGALAGGGNGAAIGALSGAVSGGALQLVTRGKAVKVPAETVLTFQLKKPLDLYHVQ